MQENRKVTVGISPTPEILNPQCSCIECDSVTCFAKRQADQPCSCEVCKNSCLIYKHNINPRICKAESLIFKDIEKELHPQENVTSEIIKNHIIYEHDNNNHVRVISQTQSRSSYKIVSSKDKLNEKGNDSLTRISEFIANRHKELGPSTAKLSAQVMDLPYKDFQNSISKPHFPPTLSNISPFDIFSRIKEAYKACSCKVCECIVGKSLQNDLCKCKPCECNDCASFSRRVKSFTNGEIPVPNDDESCPCIRCERGSCKGIGKGKTRAQECDCVGVLQHNYLRKERKESFSNACDCEPCQCIECAPRSIHRHKALIVAPVGEEYQHRNVCQCSPCECFECARGFRLSSNHHNEMSTSMNRHPQCLCESCINEACIPDGTQSCRCERQSKVMSKPFQQDSHDYDIRRTTVTYNDEHKFKEPSNYDTITMFAAVTNSYPKSGFKSKQCDCDHCECLDCKSKKITDNTGLSKVFEPIQNYQLKNEAKSSPCEFNFFDRNESKLPYRNKINVCGCDVCECISCDAASTNNKCEVKKSNSKFSAKGDCRCNPCDCADCEKLMTTCVGDICMCSNCRCENCMNDNYSDEVIYPVKRGERLTPSLFRKKIKDAFIESCINTLEANEDILKQPVSFKSSMKKSSVPRSVQQNNTLQGYDVSNQKYFQERYLRNIRTRTETVKHAQVTKCVDGPNLHHTNEPTLESNLSTYSSTSFLKESGSVTPSKHKQRSWESSCNSSGHDYPNYLVHFPRNTVETCLNDVLQLNTDTNNNIKLTPITTLSSNNNVRNQHNKEFNINFRLPPSKCLPMRTIFSQENPSDMYEELPKIKRNYFNYSQNLEDNAEHQNFKVTTEPYLSKAKERQANSVVTDLSASKYENNLPVNNKHNSFSKDNDLSNFAISQDYERVQNTLQEARMFSLHLVQLLEKYEKANREFESVSKKINNSSYSLSNKTSAKDQEENLHVSFDMDEVPTKEQELGSSGSSTEELVLINDNAKRIELLTNSCGQNFGNKCYFNNFENKNEPCSENNEGRDESGDDVIKKIDDTLNTITEEKEPIDVTHKHDRKKKVTSKFHKRYSKMYKRSIITSKKITSSNVEVDATIAMKTIENLSHNIEKIPQNNDRKHENNNKDIDTEIKPQITEDVKLRKPVNKSTTELRVSVTEKYTKDQHIFQKDVVVIKQPMVEHSRQIVEMKEPWPVLKKNLCLPDTTTQSLLTPLEKGIKTATQMISKQPPEENATYLYENKALIKLHSEVKKLLHMPILQTTEDNFKVQKDNKDNMFNCLSKTSSSQTNQGSEDIPNLQSPKITTAVEFGEQL